CAVSAPSDLRALHSFPTRRSSDLTFRVIPWEPGTAFFLLDFVNLAAVAPRQVLQRVIAKAIGYRACFSAEYEFFFFRETPQSLRDRKSTRLNSSHEWISYAVFCLK